MTAFEAEMKDEVSSRPPPSYVIGEGYQFSHRWLETSFAGLPLVFDKAGSLGTAIMATIVPGQPRDHD